MTAAPFEPTEIEVPTLLAVQLDVRSRTQPEEIGEAMRGAFQRLGGYVGANRLEVRGAPRAVYHRWDEAGTEFTLAFPVGQSADELPAEEGITVRELAGGATLRFEHIGPYERLRETYGAITEWLKGQGWLESDRDWAKFMPVTEEYVGDPLKTPPEELLTYIYLRRSES